MELLARFAAGDLDAFEELFRRAQADVYGWIVRIVRDRAAAEDLTIETFCRIYRARARFDPGRSFEAWARRIATNVAIDQLKTVRREVPLPESLSSDPTRDPVAERELRDAIRAAFRRLPPRLQAAATLALIEERPYAEIAAALDISVTAVKSRVFRAVRLLRRRLRNQGVGV